MKVLVDEDRLEDWEDAIALHPESVWLTIRPKCETPGKLGPATSRAFEQKAQTGKNGRDFTIDHIRSGEDRMDIYQLDCILHEPEGE